MKYQFSTKPGKEDLIEDAFCLRNGYQDFDDTGTPNPESKKDFCERLLKSYFIEPYLTQKEIEALKAIKKTNNGDI